MVAAPEDDGDDASSSSSSSHSNIQQQQQLLLNKESSTTTTASSSSALIILSFDSLEDVQTRLVLLPRIEEEGVGAVVEQLEQKTNNKKKISTFAITSSTTPVVTEAPHKKEEEDENGDGNNRENHDGGGAQSDDSEKDDDDDDDVSSSMAPLALRGYILLGICCSKEEQAAGNDNEIVLQDDLKDQDFASILAAIRSAPTPILLQFIQPEEVYADAATTSTTADAARVATTITTTTDCHDKGEEQKKTDQSGGGDHTDSSSSATTDDDDEEHDPSTGSNSCSTIDIRHEESGHIGTITPTTTATTTTTAAAPTLPQHVSSLSQQQQQSVQKFMSWASRISTTSVAQLAAETSSTLQSAVVEAAAIASRKKMGSPTVVTPSTTPAPPAMPSTPLTTSATAEKNEHTTISATTTPAVAMPTTELGLYLQAASGDFIPLDVSSSSSSSQRPANSSSNNSNNSITNSSLLLIRKVSPSAEPCPTLDSGFSYQWYRSSGDRSHQRPKQQHQKQSSMGQPYYSLNITTNSLPEQKQRDDGHGNGPRQEHQQSWTLLPGATRAAFQPTATEVGHWLRCVVRIHNNKEPERSLLHPHPHQHDSDDEAAKANRDYCSSGSSSSSCSSSVGEENDNDQEEVIILETYERVSAALALFNGSRQALVRGAQFGGLVGRGNAEGRQFRLKISMTTTCSMLRDPMTPRAKRVTSAVTIYQVSGSTAEPMHPENQPIVCVSAVADHNDPKALELTFPKGLPESAGLVDALTTDGRFQLAASNRIGRESLLLSIGIANFDGKPVDLDASKVLFDDEDDYDVHRWLDASSSSSGSAASTGGISSTGGALSCCCDESTATSDSMGDHRLFHGGIPPLSPANSAPATPCRRGGDDNGIISMIPQQSQKRSHSFDASSSQVIVDFASPSPVAAAMEASRINDMEKELQFLRGKLTRKDKAFSELQRHVAQSEASQRQLEHQVSSSQEELNEAKSNLCAAENRVASLNDKLVGVRNEHAVHVSSLESNVVSQSDKIAALEKSVRALKNEKALLAASVEARESKLAKMAILQTSFEQLSEKVSESDALRAELEEANRRHKENTSRLQKLSLLEQDRRSELEKSKQEIAELATQLEEEQARTVSCRSELETQQMKIQKLKAERNSYKQKGDSLAKEIAKVCRNGRTIKDVEKIILDDASRKQEVTLLREQKRKALDEIQQYRTALEQCRTAQKMAGLDHDATRVLERNAELERLLSELTEYIAAKEQQVDTLRLVNDELQSEIRTLTKSNMCKNLGKNDV